MEIVGDGPIGDDAKLGYFGMSVPAEYGGQSMGNLVMIEELRGLERRLGLVPQGFSAVCDGNS